LVDSTFADVVAQLLLGSLVGERLHCLVTAHPDVAVNPPDREDVIRVDERPVDVRNGYGPRRNAACVSSDQ